ncbi:hypothetical protein ACSBR2_039448 [Camellia fascicularis]
MQDLKLSLFVYQLGVQSIGLTRTRAIGKTWVAPRIDEGGPLPNISGLMRLQSFTINSNCITGQVSTSLMYLPSLEIVNLTNSLLQGPTPKFDPSVVVDIDEFDQTNNFCLPYPEVECDRRVNTLLSIVQSVNYPIEFAKN